MDRGNVTKEQMIDGIMCEHSYFFDEGKCVLVQEFGKEYGTYFSIMSALARGVTTRNEIEQIVGMSIGGHLTRLEETYSLVRKHQPIFETNINKSCRYRIQDNFFAFWFRFIFKHADLIELKREAMRIDLKTLEMKTEAFLRKNPDLRKRKVSFAGLSMADM